jgi:hypothetical protein
MTTDREKFLTTIAKAGPWAVLACAVIAFVFLEIRPTMARMTEHHDAIIAGLAEQRAEDAADFKQIQNLLGQILMANERTAYLQRVQCQNAAETPEELRRCARDHEP